MVHILWLVLTGQRTPAVFVANYQYVDSRHRPSSFFPVVRFTVPHGHTHVVRTTSGTTPPEFAVGHHVTVIYDPHHPETAFIDSWHDLWEGPLMMIGTGTLFALAFLRAALAERTPDAD